MEYELRVEDNAISDELRQRVWSYLGKQRWSATWKPIGRAMHGDYVPSRDGEYAFYKWASRQSPSTYQHRAGFASDEETLKKHPVIVELWQAINAHFNNEFELTGHPEEITHDPADTSWDAPTPVDTNLEAGWRVYSSAQFDESSKRTHGVHRDSPFVDDDKNWTILFCANPEWYPTWFADCVFYHEDPEGKTGDRQQYQNMNGVQNQNRNFPIGWPKQIVSPAPGRIIAYDGRNLHTTHPAASWGPGVPRRVVAFRVQKKS